MRDTGSWRMIFAIFLHYRISCRAPTRCNARSRMWVSLLLLRPVCGRSYTLAVAPHVSALFNFSLFSPRSPRSRYQQQLRFAERFSHALRVYTSVICKFNRTARYTYPPRTLADPIPIIISRNTSLIFCTLYIKRKT